MIRVWRHAAVFGLAPMLQKAFGIVLLPLYTHYLTASDYGQIEAVTVATGLLALLLRFELRIAYLRAWIAAPDDRVRAGLFRTVLRWMLLAGSAAAAIVLGSGGLGILADPVALTVVAVGLFADIVLMVCQATLQAALRSTAMVAIGMMQFAISAGLTVVGVVGLGLGPVAVFTGAAAGSVVGLAASVAVLRPVWRGPAARVPIRPLLRYAWPLLGAGLLFFVLRNADRITVARFGGVAELGLYALAWTIANVLMTMVFAPLQASFDVWRLELFEAGRREAEMARFVRLAMVVLGMAAVGLCGFGADAFALAADARFAPVLALLPWLCAAILLQAGYSFVASAFFVTGATGRWLLIFGAAAVAQVGLCWVLVPTWGLAGAAAAIGLANAALYTGAAWFGRKLWAVPWPHRAVATVIAAMVVCATLRNQQGSVGLPWALLADILSCMAFAGAMVATGVIDRADRHDVVQVLRHRQGARA